MAMGPSHKVYQGHPIMATRPFHKVYLKLLQKTDIIFVKKPHIVNLIF